MLMITQKRTVIISKLSDDTKYIKIKEFAIKNLIRLIDIAICSYVSIYETNYITFLLYQTHYITRYVSLTPMTT